MADDDLFSVERRGEVTIVSAGGSLEEIDIALSDEIARTLLGTLEGDESPVVLVDLAKLGYLGSPFVAVLIRCHQYLEKRGGTLALAGVPEQARRVLDIAALSKYWPIYRDRTEALSALTAE